ncbi:hypothetical protein AAVH_15815 [Aphelenchoides avenae]|nr:hypothetical protein AAVH_15815 [Aphelenchus avenae]
MPSKLLSFAIVLLLIGPSGAATGDKANANFAACCKSKGLPCNCKYGAPISDLAGCLTEKFFTDYSYCTTGGNDLTVCCKESGVKNPLCLELCTGSKPISHKSPFDYAACAEYRDKILKCNMLANDH